MSQAAAGAMSPSRTADEKARLAAEIERVVWPWIEAGTVKAVVDRTFPLAEAAQAPKDFLFAWKVSRFITHNKKLKDCPDSVDLVFGRMAPLGEKLGPALVQLPPQLRRNDERLESFMAWLPKDQRVAFEFRHDSWYDQGVYDLLRRHKCAFVISDHHSAPAPTLVTADWVYWRGHGPGGRYAGSYSDEALAAVARDIEGWRARGLDVYAYFDNDIKSAAPHDALRLRALLA